LDADSAAVSFRIIYEDERLFVVDKASGVCVIQPRRRESGTPLVEQVASHLNAKAWTVHRIDRATSGLVLFAKDAEAHRELSKAFERREVEKTYLAMVEGDVASPGVVTSPLKDRGSGRVSVYPQGKSAETRFEPKGKSGSRTLLEVRPLTGRRHQIRVHLYSIGHRIVGDPLYGKPKGDEGRMLLHAWKLRISQGVWGEAREFTAPRPKEFGEEDVCLNSA
jgi:tRNA pseudouridine32 synthase / 23S rRNA pseudouridine746 synthase